MKNRKIRFLLFLLLCVFSQGVRADWTTVWSEDFNDVTYTSSLTGWSFVGSYWVLNNVNNSTNCLRVGTGSTLSSATTPAIGTAGHLLLSFNYSNETSKYTDFNITVTGGGTIIEEQTAFTVSANTSQTAATFNIVGATTSTRITFETTSNTIYIDNIVVQAESATPTPITVEAPHFTLPAGNYATAQSLQISCDTEGASIYYTTDGTTPTNESTPYTGAITISETQTVKAIAYKGETASDVTEAEYFIGTTLFLDEFAGETNGYMRLEYSYTKDKLNIGRSAILTFKLSGRNASSSATLRVIENYEENNTQKYRTIINDAVISPTQNEWTTYKYAVPMQYDNSTITLSIASSNCDLDDVMLVTPPTITLSQEADDYSDMLTANSGEIVDVATVRTLRGGIWNTLCLPFDINRSCLYTALGVSQYLVMTTFSSYANNVMTFSTVTGDDVITAGTPFLLKCNTDCFNPTFRAVTIARATPQAVTDNGVTFQGCFWRTPLNTDGTDLFLGTDNYLYIPASGTNVLGGLRAYIHLGSSGVRPVLTFEDEATMIREKDAVGHAKTVYTLQGQRVVKPKRGLYVSEGKKFVVK